MKKQMYDDIAETWNDHRNRNAINPCIQDFVSYIKPHGRVMDIGCGTGIPIDAYLSDCGFLIDGIDPSTKMIDIAKKNSLDNVNYYVADFLSYQTDIKYDGIIAFDSLWHIPLDDQEKIYPKLRELLKPGGYFLMTHGKSHGEVDGEMFGHPFHYASLSISEVENLLQENGMEIVKELIDFEEEITGSREFLVTGRLKIS